MEHLTATQLKALAKNKPLTQPPMTPATVKPVIKANKPALRLVVEYTVNPNLKLSDSTVDDVVGKSNSGGTVDTHSRIRELVYEFNNQQDLTKAQASLRKAGYKIKGLKR